MNKLEFNPAIIVEFPNSTFNVPVTNDLLFSTALPDLEITVDNCQQVVKNQNDFSKQIPTSGGFMYVKSRPLF